MKLLATIITALCLTLVAQAEEKSREIVLTSDNTIVLDSQVNTESVNKVMSKAKELDAKMASGYPIYLFLYTPGGSIQDGIELIEFLNGLNRPVHTVTMFAASMGFQIAQHMGKRYITKYGVLMSHKARGGFSGEFGGTLSQLDTRYSMWLRRLKMMDEQTVKRTNGKQTLESYVNAYSPELWLNGPEAVEKGYADEVVTVKCDASLNKVTEEVVDFGLFKVKVSRPQCPIQTGIASASAEIITNKGTMGLDEFLEKNGKFGCKKTTSETASTTTPTTQYAYGYYFNNNYSGNKEETELCAKDPELTLETIRSQISKIKKDSEKSLDSKVVYSY